MTRLECWIICAALLRGALCLTQRQLEYIGQNLDVRVKVTDNLRYDGAKHTMIITLTNVGRRPIDTRGLDLFFHSFFMVEPDHLPAKAGYHSRENNIKLKHINGMLFHAKFMPRFGVILPNGRKSIKLTVQDWAVSKTDIPNNWYVVSDKLDPVVLKATAVNDQSFVDDFVDPNQYKRYKADRYSPFTPIERFTRIKAGDLGNPPHVKFGVTPTPKQVAFDTAAPITVDNATWYIVAPPNLEVEATHLRDKLGLPMVNTPRGSKAIILELGDTGSEDPESYTIQSYDCSDTIVIRGKEPPGVFYGIQSLVSLLNENGNVTFRKLPGFRITDEPRYEYRGLHLDVARNFQPKETVMKLMDTMAMYKLNKLHLHLSDDEAWRLEIQVLPELANVAAKRCHDLKERTCIIPQLGSGPHPRPPGTGFYKVQDYKDILTHAKKNHIEVIPEFQMPSHAHAAIKAMEERFRKKKDIDMLLTDLEDKSNYLSVQMFSDDAMNPCIESTYNFLRTVIKSVKRMHIDIQPLKIFNLGGEAVPNGAWVNSSACRQAFPNVSPEDLPVYAKAYFMSRLAKMVIVDEKLKMAAYEDAFFMNGQPLPGGSKNLLVYPYQNVWEWGQANRAYKFANAGYPVVMSPVTHLSFDHPYEPDPNERGLYWASRFTDTYKTFTLRPDNLYDNIDVKRSGEPITRREICGINDVNCDPLLLPENIKGIQAFGWTELIKDEGTLEHMLFPRVLALAERAWNKGRWENNTIIEPDRDWEMFANKLGYRELPRLDTMGVEYRVSPPGLAVSTTDNRNFQLTMKSEFPGLRLQYSVDGGTSWTEYGSPFFITDVNQTVLYRTVTKDGQRTSRVIGFAINDLMAGKR